MLTCVAAEKLPNKARHVAENALHEQDEGHPLVVEDVLTILVLARDVVLERQVVCILHPAVVVGVFDPATCAA